MIKIATQNSFATDAMDASNSNLVVVSFHGNMNPDSESMRDLLYELHDSLGTFDLVTVDVALHAGIAFRFLATGLPRTMFLRDEEQAFEMLETVATSEELTSIINGLVA